MARLDFDIRALQEAIDQQRAARGMSWAAVALEINRSRTDERSVEERGHPLAASTIMGLKDKAQVEGDGILQMLLWLRRTPESFVPGLAEADAERFRLPKTETNQVLRWDTKSLHAALNAQRQARGMTWNDVAREIGGFTPGMLTRLAKGGRIGFPRVMRLVGWLDQPAAAFTRASDR